MKLLGSNLSNIQKTLKVMGQNKYLVKKSEVKVGMAFVFLLVMCAFWRTEIDRIWCRFFWRSTAVRKCWTPECFILSKPDKSSCIEKMLYQQSFSVILIMKKYFPTILYGHSVLTCVKYLIGPFQCQPLSYKAPCTPAIIPPILGKSVFCQKKRHNSLCTQVLCTRRISHNKGRV